MTTNSLPSTTHRRLLLVRSAHGDAARGPGPRRYRLARLDLGPPPGRSAEERFSHLKRMYD